MQGVEYISASTVAENKTHSYPIYLNNITSNKDNQDIVSMGFNSVMLCKKVLENNFEILSINFLAAFYAIKYNNLFDHICFYEKIFNWKHLLDIRKKNLIL